MAWTTPSTWVAGNILTAAQLNQQLRDNMNELAPFFSAFTSWAPTLTQGVAVTFTNNDSKYLRIGKLVVAYTSITASSSGTAGQTVTLGFGAGGTALPTARASTSIFGSYRFLDAGATNYVGTVIGNTTTAVIFYKDADGNPLGPTGGVQVTTNDVMSALLVYEAA
jgi:hypothetical protein